MSKSKVLGLLILLLVFPALGLAQKQSKVPVLIAISPGSATAGGSSLTLTATGSNFTSGSVVQWNGSSLSTTVVNSSQLNASVGSSQIASAGTATVKVYTSGRFGGTSNGLTFTINAPAAPPPPPPPAPPPSPDPLSITTSSVPAGTAGSAYNTPLAASGGTPAYGWSKVSGGGDLPPGLALSSSGTLSGTPTTGGTFSFTAQANDSSSTQQTAQKVFSLTVAAPPDSGTSSSALFQTGFETGLPGGFDVQWNPTDITVNTNPTYVHSGTASAQFHYHICSDSTNPVCGSADQDINRWFEKDFNASNGYPNGLDHLFIRGYVYFQSPQPGAALDNLQRKVYYIGNDPSTYQWSFVLTTDSANGQIIVRFSTNGNPYVPAFSYWNMATLNYNQWYCLELEILLNTPGSSDGRLTLWVNGTQAYQQTGVNLRGSYTSSAGWVHVGVQTDRGAYLPVDEYRYWDDIVISTSYVGP